MKRFGKVISLSLATALLTAAMTGCGGSNPSVQSSSDGDAVSAGSASKAESGEPATISWYILDDLCGDHTKVVWDAINAYSKEKINTIVDYHIISGGDWGDKTNTILTSGQEFDVMFMNNTYFSTVASGAALPVEDYLKTDAKETWDLIPEAVWNAVTVKGHIYGIPVYKDTAAFPGLIYNKDMAEDLGVTIPQSFQNMRDLNDLFYESKQKRDEKYPTEKAIPILTDNWTMGDATENFVDQLACTNVPGIDYYAGQGSGERVFSVYDTDDYAKDMKMIRKWVEDGIYPMDAGNYDTERSLQNSGKIMFRAALGYVSFPENGWSDQVRTGWLPSTNRYMTTDYATQGVNLFGAKSKHPDKAAAFMNLVNTDNFVATTLRFGTEGNYYTKLENGQVSFQGTLNEDPANRAYYKWYGWTFGSIFTMSVPETESPDLWDKMKKANENAFVADNMGFVFDRSPVQNEITACCAARDEFNGNLKSGMNSDVEKGINDLRAKLKASGIDRVVGEAQKQLNEWRAANGMTVAE